MKTIICAEVQVGWLAQKKKKKGSSYCRRQLCVTTASSHLFSQRGSSHPNAFHQRPFSVFSGAGVVSHVCPLSLVADAVHSEHGGPKPPEAGSALPLCQLLPSSSAFQLASGLGAFRYPELIKVCDRFQLECEFLPETLTIRSPKHGAQC